MAATKGKKKPVKAQEKTYTFSFTVAELIGLCAGGVVALCAFFVLGILLGRGYQPEKDVPELAMMMPNQANSSGEVKGGVLKPEELDYIDQLRKKPESAVHPDLPEKKPVEAKPPVKPSVKNNQVAVKPKPEVKNESVIEIDNPAEVDEPVYNYIYQAASFGEESRAVEFRDRLTADGLDVFVESGKGGSRTWYRVFVHYTGTPKSTNGMKTVLRKHGVKKPILKSKIPVS